jgi:hypothetical protein
MLMTTTPRHLNESAPPFLNRQRSVIGTAVMSREQADQMPRERSARWALALAGGDGTRLKDLTK